MSAFAVPIIGPTYACGVPRFGTVPRGGPYEYNGNYFVFVVKTDSSSLILAKSTDGGLTWTEAADLFTFAGNPENHPALVFNTCPSINIETDHIVYVVTQTPTVDFLNRLCVMAVSLASEGIAIRLDPAGIAEEGLTYIQYYSPSDDLMIEQASDGTIGILANVTYLGVAEGPVFLYPRRRVCMLATDAGLSAFSGPIPLGTDALEDWHSVPMAIVRDNIGNVHGVFYEWYLGNGDAGTAYYVKIIDGGVLGAGTASPLLGKIHYLTANGARTFSYFSDAFSDVGTESSRIYSTYPSISAGYTTPPEAQAWCVGWFDGDFWNALFSNTTDGFYFSQLDEMNPAWDPAENIPFTGTPGNSQWNYYVTGEVVSDGVGIIFTPDQDLQTYEAWFLLVGGSGGCCTCLPHGQFETGAG